MANKLSQLVRTSTGEVATIAALADRGLIEFRKVERFHSPRSPNGHRVAYFADMRGTGNGGVTSGWEIGKLAYLSRTGQDVAP
jgi:hypothetical protein